MQDNLLFLDTETSGIPTSLNAPINELTNWPYVLQLAWLIYSPDGTLIKKENHFIYEEDIYIKNSSTKIHGITKEDLMSKGHERKTIMKILANDLRKYQPIIVGHFVEFDSKMVQVAFFRSGLKNNISRYKHFCTMRSTSEYSKLPNSTFPKLDELYLGLFGEKLENKHNAANDAEATARCFFELYKKGEIDDDKIKSQKLFVRVPDQKKTNFGCGLPILIFILIGIISIWL